LNGAYERLANNGVSHFVEHMLFVGTERWSEDEIKDIITRRGGRWNGWTGEETTTYFVQISAQDLNIALDWLAQVVFHPTFPADKIGKERQVIFQERLGRYGWLINTLDSWGFGYELDRNVRRALFPHSTLGLRIVEKMPLSSSTAQR
jgi:predicted Zn-dependent peptidase